MSSDLHSHVLKQMELLKRTFGKMKKCNILRAELTTLASIETTLANMQTVLNEIIKENKEHKREDLSYEKERVKEYIQYKKECKKERIKYKKELKKD